MHSLKPEKGRDAQILSVTSRPAQKFIRSGPEVLAPPVCMGEGRKFLGTQIKITAKRNVIVTKLVLSSSVIGNVYLLEYMYHSDYLPEKFVARGQTETQDHILKEWVGTIIED